MSFNTIEQIRSLPQGSRFTDVSTGTQRTWVVSGEGQLEWNGVRVSVEAFGPSVEAGQISEWQPPRVEATHEYRRTDGQQDNAYYLYVIAAHPNNTCDVVTMNSGGEPTGIRWGVGTEIVENMECRRTSYSGTNTYIRTMANFLAEQQMVRAGLQEALHSYLDEHSYPEHSPLEHIMTEHGMEARYADVVCTVTVTGTSMQQVDASSLGVSLGEAVVTGTIPISVPFVTVKEITVSAPGDGCRMLTQDMVKESLGFDANALSYTSTCPVCTTTTSNKK